MGRLELRFADDDPLWLALHVLPPGSRSRVARDALRVVLLGPAVLRDLAGAFGTFMAGTPSSAPSLASPPPSVDGDDFLAAFGG